MTSIRTLSRWQLLMPAACLLAACSKEAPTSTSSSSPAPATATATSESASNPLPGVIGQPSDVTANKSTKSPADASTAVGGMAAQPHNGTSATGGVPAPTGGDAAPGHAASSASQ